MEFQTLRKSHKKQIIIGALAICIIGGALTFSLTRAKYEIANDLELAKGIINYKAYDFKIMAMYKSDDKTNYTEIEEMPSEGYTINESKSYCNMSNGSKDTTATLKTVDGNHIISKLKKNDKCFIYFDKRLTASETILTNLGTSIKTTAPNFANTATTDEGVYAVSDGMYGGTSYYWRGAVTNNYVEFAGFCWRIIRINGDRTLRLIYDGTICHANGTSNVNSIAKIGISYNNKYNYSNYVGWTYSGRVQRTLSDTPSNAKSDLETWYGANIIGVNANKVAVSKFCNDRNAQSGNIWAIDGNTFYYAAHKRIYTDSKPTLSCSLGDTYELNVGLITVDEVMYAGANDINNNTYYLYNGQGYWTMSPSQWNGNYRYAYVFFVGEDGSLSINWLGIGYGLRPVINLVSNVTFSGGDGTIDSPYVVS